MTYPTEAHGSWITTGSEVHEQAELQCFDCGTFYPPEMRLCPQCGSLTVDRPGQADDYLEDEQVCMSLPALGRALNGF